MPPLRLVRLPAYRTGSPAPKRALAAVDDLDEAPLAGLATAA